MRTALLVIIIGAAAIPGGAYWYAPGALPHITIITLACLAGYLNNFVACQSVPPGSGNDLPMLLSRMAEKNRGKKELNELLDALLKQGTIDWLKQKVWEKLTDNAQLTADEVRKKIEDIDKAIVVESELLPTGDRFKQEYKKIKEQAMNLKSKLDGFASASGANALVLASTAPGVSASATKLVGLDSFVARLDRALEEATPIIDLTIEQLDYITASAKPLVAAFRASQKALPIATSPKSTAKQVQAALETIVGSCGELDRFLRELVLGGFGENEAKVRTLVELLAQQPPVVVRVARPANYQGAAFRVRAKVELDASLFGGVARGDSLSIELPCGFHLTEPLRVVPSRSMRILVTGNRAGSNAVAVDVRRCSGSKADVVTVRIDQQIEVTEHACGSGELRVWNHNRGNGVIIPVMTIDA